MVKLLSILIFEYETKISRRKDTLGIQEQFNPSSIGNPTEAWVMGWSGPAYNSHSVYVAHVTAWSRSWRVQG